MQTVHIIIFIVAACGIFTLWFLLGRQGKRSRAQDADAMGEAPVETGGEQIEGFYVRSYIDRGGLGTKRHRHKDEKARTVVEVRVDELPLGFGARLASKAEKKADVKAQEAAGVDVPVPEPLTLAGAEPERCRGLVAQAGVENAIVEFLADHDDEVGRIEDGVLKVIHSSYVGDQLERMALRDRPLALARRLRTAAQAMDACGPEPGSQG